MDQILMGREADIICVREQRQRERERREMKNIL
jgi:hypothetical protein